MPLPTTNLLATEIKNFITTNKSSDPEKATEDFANFLAQLILDTIRAGDVQGIVTIVTGSSATGGPVTGQGVQQGIAKIS